jgi:hypothetical protein
MSTDSRLHLMFACVSSFRPKQLCFPVRRVAYTRYHRRDPATVVAGVERKLKWNYSSKQYLPEYNRLFKNTEFFTSRKDEM